ncbi:MAG TPA: hypothetical protein VMI55_05955 [Thermoplasmata archaeon]|nr:hypothetical protein [Thermoplasmata archaeon]
MTEIPRRVGALEESARLAAEAARRAGLALEDHEDRLIRIERQLQISRHIRRAEEAARGPDPSLWRARDRQRRLNVEGRG